MERVKAHGVEITEVVSGNAKGVDRMGERWADDNDIPLKIMKPDWNKYKKAAGIIRNKEMADYIKEQGGAVVVLWDGESKGTKNMIETAKKMDITVYGYMVKRKTKPDTDEV